MMEGRFFGTMCLSEPQAGFVAVRHPHHRADPQADGSYRLRGNKMWISAGEHELTENIVHLVLAKIPGGAAGVKGISLFIVPKWLRRTTTAALGERNDVALAGLNHKMGYRGTTNTLLNFGEGRRFTRRRARRRSAGWSASPEHQGLACMFHMMNEARIGVGLGRPCSAMAGYLHSLRTRASGRRAARRPARTRAPQVPIIEHADVQADAARAEGLRRRCAGAVLYCARLVDEQRTDPEDEPRAAAPHCCWKC
jgi:alkylation response protein AidB-like acyl-CoA dehydrogenase